MLSIFNYFGKCEKYNYDEAKTFINVFRFQFLVYWKQVKYYILNNIKTNGRQQLLLKDAFTREDTSLKPDRLFTSGSGKQNRRKL